MPMYHFKIELVGYGKNPDEAWLDAQYGFMEEPGGTPDESEYTIEDDNGDDLVIIDNPKK